MLFLFCCFDSLYDSTDFAPADVCIIVAGNVLIHSYFSLAQKTFFWLPSRAEHCESMSNTSPRGLYWMLLAHQLLWHKGTCVTCCHELNLVSITFAHQAAFQIKVWSTSGLLVHSHCLSLTVERSSPPAP